MGIYTMKNTQIINRIITSAVVYVTLCGSLQAVDIGNVNIVQSVTPWQETGGWVYGSHLGFATNSPPSWSDKKNAVLNDIETKPSGTCFVGYIKTPVNWACSSTRRIPTSDTDTWQGYWMSSTFVANITTHETYHRNIYSEFISSQFGSIESFLNTYESVKCSTAAEAKALAKKDIEAAFVKIDNLRSQYDQDKLINHSSSYNQPANGEMHHYGAHWGQDAMTEVSAYTLTLSKSDPSQVCPCVQAP